MPNRVKLNRRIVRRPNRFSNLLKAALNNKMADDDSSVPYLHPEDLMRDKTQGYVLQ